jgi:glycosyltransferase involved in cell wall biosynthesis
MTLNLAFLTVGNPDRRTGGYLYHREVFRRWHAWGQPVDEIVLGPADVAGQLAARAQVGRRIDPSRYDVLIIDALARVVVAPWIDSWRTYRPIVALIHELPTIAGANDLYEYEWERTLLRADVLVTVSDEGAMALIERGAARFGPRIASGGWDRLRNFIPTKLPRETLVISVGQWIPRKNVAHLVRSWDQIAPTTWRLELIGETDADPDYATEVWQAIRHCSAPVIVRGVLPDDKLAECYARASIFALPSRFEGYGLVFAEALACGLPVIAGAVGPVPTLVGNGGILVPPDDEQALVNALRTVMADPLLRQHLSEAAQQRAASLPRWDETAQRLLTAVTYAFTR